ncbi:hypothetical protein EMIT0133MI5_20440 [Bacillus velezensis]
MNHFQTCKDKVMGGLAEIHKQVF